MKPTKGTFVKIKAFKAVNEDLLINSIKLLGTDKELSFDRSKKHLVIHLYEKVLTDLPICFKIELK